MFWQRAIVTTVATPFALLLIYYGGLPYFLLISGILLLAVTEYVNIMGELGWKLSQPLLLITTAAQLIAAQWDMTGHWRDGVLMLSLVLIMLNALWSYEKNKSETVFQDWLAMFGGLMLLGWFGGHFLRLRHLDDHGYWLMLALLSTWSADSGAYVVGRKIGKNKMTPRLSPNKSYEGLIAGIIASLIIVLVASQLLLPEAGLGPALGLVVSGAILSPAGDLAISLIKRVSKVKDSGQFLPGHGGALDRLDSVLWSVTLAYYFVLLLQN
ncbi:MAG TPA: phosphatidate cytidylyltransferase [Anaerolineae bacterium]|nr:phosphatidate cytidylyltransferase [Anaerolineae bacterium]